MEREIKFRARNAELPRCWIYGYFVVENGSCRIINDDGKFKVIAGTEGQYTNKNDKNGKGMYEDDVYTTGCKKYIINSIHDFHYRWLADTTDIEVIGNTFDNPELLKEE